MTFTLRTYALGDEVAVVALWRDVGLTRPWNDPQKDIARHRAVWPDLLRVATDGDRIIGAVMTGYDGHRGWLYYLATAPDRRGEGIARALVRDAEERLTALGCPKVQLMVRPENTSVRGLYAALGFEPFETWATGRRLIADD